MARSLAQPLTRRGFGALVATSLVLAACQQPASPPAGGASAGAGSAAAPAAQEATTLRIARQPGLGYLPLIVMREQKLIEKRVPGVKVEWNELTSGPAIRDAMIAGQLEVGSGGVAPFLQGFDKGIKWKTTGAMNNMPLYLVVNRPEVKALKDFTPEMKIALPAPGSIQHVTLQMAAEKELGDAKALDNNIVAMGHPDAQAALLSQKEIVGHFGSPPFQYDELEKGGPNFKVLLDSYKVLGGPHTFNLVWAMDDWAAKNPRLFQAFVDAQKEATDFINQDPAAAAKLFVEGEKSRLTADAILKQMKSDGIEFTMTPLGFMKYADFMKKTGAIKNVPASWKDYAFPHVQSLSGS